jgi:hypothetical protein
METIIGELRCEDGVVRTVVAVPYRNCNGKLRYELQLEGTDDDLELSCSKSLYEAARTAYTVWPDNFELPGSPERIGNYADEDADEGIVQVICLRFYNRWEIFLSPRKGEMQPTHLGSYPSLPACRRAVFEAYGDRVNLS